MNKDIYSYNPNYKILSIESIDVIYNIIKLLPMIWMEYLNLNLVLPGSTALGEKRTWLVFQSISK